MVISTPGRTDLKVEDAIGAMRSFVLYFVEPTVASLEGLVSMHGVLLTDDEKDSIFPQVIEFLVYLKSKIAGV